MKSKILETRTLQPVNFIGRPSRSGLIQGDAKFHSDDLVSISMNITYHMLTGTRFNCEITHGAHVLFVSVCCSQVLKYTSLDYIFVKVWSQKLVADHDIYHSNSHESEIMAYPGIEFETCEASQ